MPYKIIGKIVGDDGYPIYQSALIEELNNKGEQIASVLSDADTGDFIFLPLGENSLIRISSPGYKELKFAAKDVPYPKITLYALDSSVINFTRTKPTNAGLYIALGTIALVAIAAYAIQKNDQKKQAATAPVKSLPAAKPKTNTKPQARPVKTVTV
ncbi:hypothetical protein FUA48_08605 [Flavobacterium alkalisoli]|uniref:Uncharacterized protein n=1 Tax=Flavobacterium alkalisoli TaxID=2602769 RepID=A0A5B9FTT2_9FLAO|nr:hypothetical protein [Flavobacterium alkalisoli]QEE49641.1 hypothetical protein FUA48_08605 [Flavobacterium alkalisoli]